jgi:hypothetical protein
MNLKDDLQDQKDLARDLVYFVNEKYPKIDPIDKAVVLLSFAIVNMSKYTESRDLWDTLCSELWDYHQKYKRENDTT